MAQKTTRITAAQLNDIVTNPVNLVPAHGPGTRIVPTYAVVEYEFNGTSYTGGQYADLVYGPAENDTPCQIADAINFSICGNQPNYVARVPVVNGGIGNIDNEPLNFGGPFDFKGEGGDVLITVFYEIISNIG